MRGIGMNAHSERPAMRLALVLLFALCCVPDPRPARAADAIPGSPPPPALVSADSLALAIVGEWVSDADPEALISIARAGMTTVQIWGGVRFAAMGFIAEGAFFGIARMPGLSVTPTAPPSPSVLTFRLLPDGRIAAEFAGDLKHHGARAEFWTFKGRSRVSPPERGPARGDSLPAFGEYVYVEELPSVISKIPPDYPTWAREQGISGTVMLQALIGKDGLVKDTRIIQSIPQLDDYAVGAVRQWRFKPAMSEGRPIAVWVSIPVKFTLR